MTCMLSMEPPGFPTRSPFFTNPNSNDDTRISVTASKQCPFRFREKEYTSASDALQAYIDEYEGKSAKSRISDEAIRELLAPSSVMANSHNNSSVLSNHSERMKLEMAGDRLTEIRRGMEESYSEQIKKEIAGDRVAEMRRGMDASYRKLLAEDHKRKQVNQALVESSQALTQMTLDNLSSLPEAPSVASDLESLTTDMLIGAKPLSSPRHGHVYSYHTKHRSASMSRADSLLRRSDLDATNSLRQSLQSQAESRSSSIPSTSSSQDVINRTLHYAKPTLSNSLKYEKGNGSSRMSVPNPGSHSLRWTQGTKGLTTSTPLHRVGRPGTTSTPLNGVDRAGANRGKLSMSDSSGRFRREMKKPGVTFHSSSSDISSRGRPPPSWVNDIDGRNPPSWVSDISDAASVNSATGHAAPSWIPTDTSDAASVLISNHGNKVTDGCRISHTRGMNGNYGRNMPSTSGNHRQLTNGNLPRSSSYDDLAITQKTTFPNRDYKSRLIGDHGLQQSAVFGSLHSGPTQENETEDSILLHVKQLLDTSGSVYDEPVKKSVTFSPNTDSILDGDRSWEKPVSAFRSTVPFHVEDKRTEHISQNSAINQTDRAGSPRLTGRDQPGSMEALKNMLFTMQGVASSADGTELTAPPGSGIVTSDVRGRPETQNAGVADYDILEPQTRQMMEDSFIMNQGGESLQRALVHLSRLKTLVQTDPVSQLSQQANQNN